ncbi:tripartite tricarboxylate transporter permease [Candidatus Woesearchaeota archaeon]|nr:tripartite tricarboxylate transporter permease [Candidatus Woesearchaeota archaeon]
MLFGVIITVILGMIAGVITGLIPGIHVNLVSATLVSLSPIIIPFAGILPACCFIIAMATTHSFLDALPSVFLGAPEAATALGVLPGHRYLLKGQGLMAVKLTIIGSLGSLVLAGTLFPLLLPVVAWGYPHLQHVIGWLLLAVAVFMILRDRKPGWAAFIFLISGLLGFIVLNELSLKNPLFPLLSGLFGTATLLISLNETSSLPEQQRKDYTELDSKKTLQAFGSGTLSGFVTAVLPGIGAATAAVLSMQITRKIGDHGFMVLMGGISTSNFVLSLVTLQALGKARNGALVAVKMLMEHVQLVHVLMFLFVALLAGGVAGVLALQLGTGFANTMKKVPYHYLLLAVILLIVALTPILSGIQGIIVLVISTAVGLLPAIKKVSRTQAMGCLLVPVMTYFLL